MGLLVSGLWYVFRLETRLQTVEAQVQAIATSPIKKVQEPMESGSKIIGENPLAAACAELAKRAADQYALSSKYGTSNAIAIEQMMQKMGCYLPSSSKP